MYMEVMILIEKVFDIVGGKMKVYVVEVGIDSFVGWVKEVENLV